MEIGERENGLLLASTAKKNVPTLIRHTKWSQPEDIIKTGDLVGILEDFTPRGIWPVGRIIEIFTGPDGRARSCVIKTALGKITRPAVKLALITPRENAKGFPRMLMIINSRVINVYLELLDHLNVNVKTLYYLTVR